MGTKVRHFTCTLSNFTHILLPDLLSSPSSKPPAHRPRDAGPGSPVTHLQGEKGALGWKTSPSVTSSSRTGPGEPLWGANRPHARARRTYRAIPRFAPSWQPPSGTGARLQRPPAPGGGQGPLPPAEEKPRKTKMAPASGSNSTLGQAGQSRGCHLGGSEPGPGHASLLPAPSRALHWADTLALLVQRLCLQNCGGHSLQNCDGLPGA